MRWGNRTTAVRRLISFRLHLLEFSNIRRGDARETRFKACRLVGRLAQKVAELSRQGPQRNRAHSVHRAGRVHAKPLRGVGGGVLEIATRFDGGTYRTVYAVKIAGKVYVLHVFQKKSKAGIKTPQQDMDLIVSRLKEAHRREGHT